MQKFTNPLDKIKIASPCGANWKEMRGDNRRRYCTMCKLNVYNLSNMTREEAESFLINSEGRVCVRIYRRSDGSVITKDCPVGWQKLKRKVSRTATAVFSLIAGFLGGNLVSDQTAFDNSDFMKKVPVVPEAPREIAPSTSEEQPPILLMGKPFVKITKREKKRQAVVGALVMKVRDLKDEPVVLWIK
jgi:hypothetical protein